ncbi:MAG: hypothetical protein DLM68_18650 [Hyphomicrobiales bacterium]|nr:MAG: hypothetical protein DLM68_18650 [Hyphomicrobiales bacterium]
MGDGGKRSPEIEVLGLDDTELAAFLVNENGYWMDAETALRSFATMPFVDQKVPEDFCRASHLTISGGTWRSSRHLIEIGVSPRRGPLASFGTRANSLRVTRRSAGANRAPWRAGFRFEGTFHA